MKNENKPWLAAALSLISAVLFLFAAVLLAISQPFSFLMASSVATIFFAVLMLEYPHHNILYGSLIIAASCISFLSILLGARWDHIIMRRIFLGILPLALGVMGGALTIFHKFFEFKIEETPKSFLKKCPNCKKEIPIASEKCPHCGSTQGN